MTRAGLISMIYDKTMTLKAKDLKDAKAVTLKGTDMERILNAIKNMHETWASVVQAGIAIWLLEHQSSCSLCSTYNHLSMYVG